MVVIRTLATVLVVKEDFGKRTVQEVSRIFLII